MSKGKSRRRKNKKVVRIRGTYYLSQAGGQTVSIRSLILRRRLQILIHSYIYYECNESLVSDYTWSKWARELVKLQRRYPQISTRVDYAKDFEDFDPSTGYNLPIRNPEISRKARQILSLKGRYKK